MSADRWAETDRVLQAALARPAGEREAFVRGTCGADADLAREVLSLLVHADSAEDFLKSGLGTRPAPSAAPVRSGERIGPYLLGDLLGVGGMGEVFRARDTKLNRDVAIKFLPESVAGDPDRRARFEREARALAALNHPNIAAVYAVEDRAMVMELVSGMDLSERIAQGPLRLPEALAIGKQIAEALEAAHEGNIVHRDLKPANVRVREDGMVKVLDFGLAKARDEATARLLGSGPDPQQADSPTLTGRWTRAGVLLGTAAYMAPEQARGKPVDKRADIWAFGAVLYEMLTGRVAFAGDTITDVLSAVVEKDPDWGALPAGTPPLVERTLRRCLTKDVKQRLHDIGDARLELEEAIAPGAAGHLESSGHRPPRARLWPIAAAVAATALIVAGIMWGLTRSPPAAPGAVTRFEMDIQPANLFGTGTTDPNDYARPSRLALAVSPNGRLVVFSASMYGKVPQLFSKVLDQQDAKPIAGTDGAINPFFSPDGKWIGFAAGGKMKKILADGGMPTVICDAGTWGMSWLEDDSILFGFGGTQISRVPAAGGTPEVLAKSDPTTREQFILPHALPGGKSMLFTTVRSADWNRAATVLQSFTTGARRVLIEGAVDARYVRSGHLVYLKGGALMAVPFDPATEQMTGAPVVLVDAVMQSVNMPLTGLETGVGQYAVSDAGTLLYLSGGPRPSPDDALVWLDRNGVAQVLPGAPIRPQWMPRLSPDQVRVALKVERSDATASDLFMYDIVHGTQTRLTFAGDSSWPVWSPDGTRLVYSSTVSGQSNLYVVSTTNPGPPVRLTESGDSQFASSWTAAGDLLAYLQSPASGSQIWVLPMDGHQKPRLFAQSPNPGFTLRYPEFSPDGKWIAYVSDEAGSTGLYVQPYPGPGERYLLTAENVSSPIWTAGGRELLYGKGGARPGVYSVSITSVYPLRWDSPRLLFPIKLTDYGVTTPVRGWDSTPDGRRFLATRLGAPKDKAVTQIHVVLNWTEELKRLVPVSSPGSVGPPRR